jgi:serine/threonine protein phosphatase PrpC
VRLADGTPISRDRLDQLIAEARAEAWDLLAPTAPSPAPELPPGVNRYEAAVDDLLEAAHLSPAHALPELLTRHAAAVGATSATAYLADLQQQVLVPLVGTSTSVAATRPTSLDVDTTVAGRSYQHLKVLTQQSGPSSPGLRVWLPLLDGTERLGVLGVVVPPGATADEVRSGALGRRLRRLAAIAAELVVTKSAYGDTIVRTRRLEPMDLAAELQWSQLPPLTFACHQVTIAAALEPAYSVAGDAVDYTVDAGWARFAVFDGMGHGLRSVHLSTLAVAAYRNSRRAGRTLPETARAIDDAVRAFSVEERYCGALLAELDTSTGRLSWVNAGVPHPLVLRDGRLARTLQVQPALPFGMGAAPGAEPYAVGTERLQRQDRLVLYTDGVTDACDRDGNVFGTDRLVDLLTRTDDPHLPAPETMRRVVRALLAHQQYVLQDDATLLAVDWRSDDEDDFTP